MKTQFYRKFYSFNFRIKILKKKKLKKIQKAVPTSFVALRSRTNMTMGRRLLICDLKLHCEYMYQVLFHYEFVHLSIK